ncbi:hypothetical protein QBC36DRAFT_353990 [Triangularia setosa]|uniref:Uncharacterized protein n=1 Tax=Triangularia setosa TaxID=2587417 RepID=A0AAN7ACG6_9PEZI|nr:hypothetical protein QBC36DRAFT_353990 [Podospora setosa]
MYVSVILRSNKWPKNIWAFQEVESGKFVARFQIPKPVTDWHLGPHRYQVSSSLQTISKPDATLNTPPTLCSLFALMKTDKVTVMVLMCIFQDNRAEAQKQQSTILCTLGDAIASSMRNPDPTMADVGLAAKDDFLSKRTWYGEALPPQSCTSAREFKRQPEQRRSVLSPGRWIVGVLSLVPLLVGGTMAYSRGTQPGLFSNVIIANTPQLALSIAFVIVNASLTAFLIQHDFRPDTQAVGIQSSTYLISLPLQYGIPFYVIFAAFHWWLSQSLLLRVTAMKPEGEIDREHSCSTCGFSPPALFTTILTEIAFVLGFLCLSMGRYDGVMRMASTNSRAISAACHVLPEDRKDGYLLPMQWGVVAMSRGVGKGAFTATPEEDISMSEEGKRCK